MRTRVRISAVADRNAVHTKRRCHLRGAAMSLSTDRQEPSRPADEPLALAARSEQRLTSALRRIAVGLGDQLPVLYADLDALGRPVVRFGPLPAALADRMSEVLELAEALTRAVNCQPAVNRVGGVAPC